MSKKEPANYGIVGNVTAKVVAVGPRSQAVVHESSPFLRSEFDAAVADLRSQVAALAISEHDRELLTADLGKIHEMSGEKSESKPGASELLNGFVGKLKLLGGVLEGTSAVYEPIKKIASWFHLTLPF
jgi:hypothetical protein